MNRFRKPLRFPEVRLGRLAPQQIGKYYPFETMMNNPGLGQLLKGIKGVVDPDGLMNPGALGLGLGLKD